jgi:hypothetical protein
MEDMLYDHVCGAHGCTDPTCRIEYGYCHCGCGGETNFVTSGSKGRGTYQETPRRFLARHNLRGKTPAEESKRERGEAFVVRADGYRAIPLDPDAIFAGMAVPGATYIREHLVVMALQLGRPLYPGESVWHISGDRSDNRPENLVLLASPDALKRTLSGGRVDPAEVVWRPEWTVGLDRSQMVEQARGQGAC